MVESRVSAMSCGITILFLCLLVTPVLCSMQLSRKHLCMRFLEQHMPEKDRTLLDHKFLKKNVKYALKARNLTTWGSKVHWKLFLNDVLPYAVLNERRDDWRGFFFKSLSPLVANTTSIEEAAYVINSRIWSLWNLTFVGGQTPQTMSPFQVLKAHNASCTGFSILLVDALRSVGIPARVVGTPEWNDGSGGNHDWVEVWFNRQYNYIDAFDGTKFNEGWFVPTPVKYQLANSGNHSIYATSFKPRDHVHFPMAWDFQDLSVPGIDVTQVYLDRIQQEAENSHVRDLGEAELAKLGAAAEAAALEAITEAAEGAAAAAADQDIGGALEEGLEVVVEGGALAEAAIKRAGEEIIAGEETRIKA